MQYDLHFAGAHSIVIIIIIIVTAAVCYITDVSVCSSHFGILCNLTGSSVLLLFRCCCKSFIIFVTRLVTS